MRGLLLTLAYTLMRLQWRILHPITIGVRMIALRDAQVLLVRHTYQAGWHFPGGGMKRGETPLQAAKREAFEEAGVRCTATPRLLGIYSSFVEGKSDHVATYVTESFTLDAAPDRWEIAEARWFPVDALPEAMYPGARRQVQEAIRSTHT